MVLWAERHVAYKVSFSVLVFSIIIYVIGFSLPYWSVLTLDSYGQPDQTIGLWQGCIQKFRTCASNVHGRNPPWINATRALCSFALIFYALVLVSGYHRNVSRYGQFHIHSPGRHIECMTVMGTVIGLVGCIVYAAEFHLTYVAAASSLGHLSWAFGLVCGSLALAGLSGCVMFVFNKPGRHRGPLVRHARGHHGYPVAVQFASDTGDECVHIPYFGDVTPAQLTLGASPTLPPSYEVATGGGLEGYSRPPKDVSDAPPVYEEVSKEGVKVPVVDHSNPAGKEEHAHSNPALTRDDE